MHCLHNSLWTGSHAQLKAVLRSDAVTPSRAPIQQLRAALTTPCDNHDDTIDQHPWALLQQPVSRVAVAALAASCILQWSAPATAHMLQPVADLSAAAAQVSLAGRATDYQELPSEEVVMPNELKEFLQLYEKVILSNRFHSSLQES